MAKPKPQPIKPKPKPKPAVPKKPPRDSDARHVSPAANEILRFPRGR